jgi:hypothetical protein
MNLRSGCSFYFVAAGSLLSAILQPSWTAPNAPWTSNVFVVMEIGSRRILHYNVTAHPTAEWRSQQFREAPPGDHPYRVLIIHDRDSIFAEDVDKGLATWVYALADAGASSRKRTSVCERLGGSFRRECLVLLIPLSETPCAHDDSEWQFTITGGGHIRH